MHAHRLRHCRVLALVATLCAGLEPGARAAAAASAGEQAYRRACASCHDAPLESRARALDALRALSPAALKHALTEGAMQGAAAQLDSTELASLVDWLASGATNVRWHDGLRCAPPRQPALGQDAAVAQFGFDRANTRALRGADVGLARPAAVEPAWALGFPNTASMRAQAAVVGDTIFLPVADLGGVYALSLRESAKPCLLWAYEPGGAPMRTSAAYGVTRDGVPLVVTAGADARVHAIDARSGRAVWTRQVKPYRYSITTGTPVVLPDRVLVPVSQFEITTGANPRNACCDNHGVVIALDARSGAPLWRYDTMEDATPQDDRGDGVPLLGPSGAPIWNSPLVDTQRGLVFVGTGEANSAPAHRNTNAVIAIDLATGHERWSMQATPRDIFLVGCQGRFGPRSPNCPRETVARDVDFGASLVLGAGRDGRERMYAAQKSGAVWALDPDTGAVLWRAQLGTGGPLGGVHWGIAFAHDTVFVPISAVGDPIAGEWTGEPPIRPGLYALDAVTGAVRWSYHADGGQHDRRGTLPNHAVAMSAAPTVIDDVVLCATLDGTLHALDVRSGAELWRQPTAQAWATVNGVPARGGAIDAASIYAGHGLLLVNSGYGSFGQRPGNVLLAFRVKPARE